MTARTLLCATDEMPISGCRIITGDDPFVAVETAGGHRLPVQLIGGLLLGAWRGERRGRPWALAAGRITAGLGPVYVHFVRRDGDLSRTVVADPNLAGGLWVAEVAGPFERILVRTPGATRIAGLSPVILPAATRAG